MEADKADETASLYVSFDATSQSINDIEMIESAPFLSSNQTKKNDGELLLRNAIA